jgi:hypothetical protein
VLRAGVAHRLAEQARQSLAASGTPEFALAVFSTWRDDPLAGLTRAVRDSVARVTHRDPGPVRPGGRLADAFAEWAELVGGEVMVVLDQFEEYFLYHSREDGEGTFAVEFPRLVNREGLRVNFLLAIREDALARLDRFKGRIPKLFDNYLRLQHLSLKAAEDAIRKPLTAFNASNPGEAVGIEDGLVQEVLRQTRRGHMRTGRGSAGAAQGADPSEAAVAQIETPYLQMVMTRLWDEEHAAGSHTLRLATLVEDPPKGLGGADQIVRTHLDGVMGQLGPSERDVAAQAFRFLVTRTGTKIALTVDDLAGYAALPAEALAPVLEKLAGGGRRILRPVPVPERPETTRYEIFHDVLGQAITDWRRRHEVAREQEAIRREQEQRRLEEVKAAEAKRQHERSRYLQIGLGVLSVGVTILLALSWIAWQQAREARYALALAEQAAREANSTAQAGIEARSAQASVVHPTRAAASTELREAFLTGDTDGVEQVARRLRLLNQEVRFQGQRVPLDYRIAQGQVYEFSMWPIPDSVPGGLRSLAVVTFKMNHPTFKVRLLVGDRDRGFRVGYIGWGCLGTVPVLLEYVDPSRSPEVALFEMCANLETVSREAPVSPR